MNSLKAILHIFRGQMSRTLAVLVLLTSCLYLGPINPAHAFVNGGFFYSKHFEDGAILKDFLAVVPEMEGRLSFEEVRQMPDSLFYTTEDLPFKFGETLNYWIKLRITNDTDERRTDIIASSLAYDTIEVYSIKEGYVNFEAWGGTKIPPSVKRVPSRRSLVNFELEPGQSIEYYIRGSIIDLNSRPLVFNFFIFDDFYATYKSIFFQSLYWIFLASILLLFALLAIVLYYTFREKIFIIYSLLMLFLTVYFLDYQFIMDYLVFRPFVFDRYRSNSILVAGIIFCTYLFISRFLSLPRRMPLFSNFYLLLVVVTILFSISRTFLFPFNNALALAVSNGLTFVFAVISYFAIGLLSYRGIKEAKVLLISMFFMFLGAIVFTLSLMNIIPQTDFTANSFQWGVIAFSGTLFYGLFDQVTSIQNDRIRIRVEKEKTDELLFNILPYEVATELKEKGYCEARDFAKVNVLFTDFKNFTYTSTQMSAKELVHEINSCFVHFDHLIEKYRIEKIKTIGDSYMAASGLEVKGDARVRDIIMAAIEMQEYLIDRKTELLALNRQAFEMRVGIHTGPVVAGIVGVKKFQYDIWGDTVNTASRIESYGEVGKVNISDHTYQLIKDHPEFAFEKRGEIEVKGKGKLRMWFVNRSDNQAEP